MMNSHPSLVYVFLPPSVVVSCYEMNQLDSLPMKTQGLRLHNIAGWRRGFASRTSQKNSEISWEIFEVLWLKGIGSSWFELHLCTCASISAGV